METKLSQIQQEPTAVNAKTSKDIKANFTDFESEVKPEIDFDYFSFSRENGEQSCHIVINTNFDVDSHKPGPSIRLAIGRKYLGLIEGDDKVLIPELTTKGITRNAHELAHIECQNILDQHGIRFRQGSVMNEIFANAYYQVFFMGAFDNEIKHETEAKMKDLICADIREMLKFLDPDNTEQVKILDKMRTKNGISPEFQAVVIQILAKHNIEFNFEDKLHEMYEIHQQAMDFFEQIKQEGVYKASDPIEYDQGVNLLWMLRLTDNDYTATNNPNTNQKLHKNEEKTNDYLPVESNHQFSPEQPNMLYERHKRHLDRFNQKVLKLVGDSIFFETAVDEMVLNNYINLVNLSMNVQNDSSKVPTFLNSWKDDSEQIIVSLEERPKFVFGLIMTIMNIQSQQQLEMEFSPSSYNPSTVELSSDFVDRLEAFPEFWKGFLISPKGDQIRREKPDKSVIDQNKSKK
jgi:hypothetical protein